MQTPHFFRLATGLSLAVLLCGCDSNSNEAGPGGVSVGEAKALDEAAEMIEARRLPTQALPQTAGDNVPLPPAKPENIENEGGNAE